jgi:hypothetical protein
VRGREPARVDGEPLDVHQTVGLAVQGRVAVVALRDAPGAVWRKRCRGEPLAVCLSTTASTLACRGPGCGGYAPAMACSCERQVNLATAARTGQDHVEAQVPETSWQVVESVIDKRQSVLSRPHCADLLALVSDVRWLDLTGRQ